MGGGFLLRGRYTRKNVDRATELARFLQMSVGSAYEVEYHALLARDLHFIDLAAYETLQNRIIEVKRMLAALLVKVRADSRARVL